MFGNFLENFKLHRNVQEGFAKKYGKVQESPLGDLVTLPNNLARQGKTCGQHCSVNLFYLKLS
jgi:hypothetical protein